MKKISILLNGIIKENPTFVLFLGMCPILATSKSIYSAIGMSVCVFLVLLFVKFFFKAEFSQIKEWYISNFCIDTDINQVLETAGEIGDINEV